MPLNIAPNRSMQGVQASRTIFNYIALQNRESAINYKHSMKILGCSNISKEIKFKIEQITYCISTFNRTLIKYIYKHVYIYIYIY
jgi:hypothetical protein